MEHSDFCFVFSSNHWVEVSKSETFPLVFSREFHQVSVTMSQWTGIFLLAIALPVLAQNNDRIHAFVLKVENYVNIIEEQAQAMTNQVQGIAECKNVTDAMRVAVDEQKVTIDENTDTIETLKKNIKRLNSSLDEQQEALNENKGQCFAGHKQERGTIRKKLVQ